ncbi:MAG: HD domain-containing protein [Anaerolineales bacterium]|nr:HD domain-containing protein [Anaerolineales bacterium]
MAAILDFVYRSRQFLNVLFRYPDKKLLAVASGYLDTQQMELFRRMQPAEQAHALVVMDKLWKSGYRHQDLMVAALLHDIGKVKIRLTAVDRVLAVLGEALFPGLAARWAEKPPRGIWKGFVVKKLHPVWGAEFAENVATSPLALDLIRNHQDRFKGEPSSLRDQLLIVLQEVDDKN